MKELLVVSGKGGSGKTSLSACFAKLAGQNVLIDCDVDASDLPLLLQPTQSQSHDFYVGALPETDLAGCIHCGRCQTLCRFQAISLEHGAPQLRTEACEGCGVCADHCPAGAIRWIPRRCGRWMRSHTACGPLFHAELLPGAENSGKLIAELRRAARTEAIARNCDWLLSDGPPGIGCPVISASTGVDYAIIVTEPTLSGRHDMERLAELLRQFEVPFAVIINKADLNSKVADEITEWCDSRRHPLLGRIPFDPLFSQSLRQGKTVLDFPQYPAAQIINTLWRNLISRISVNS